MSFKLNHFKGKYIGRSRIAYSLGEYVIGNFTSWIDGWECGTKQTIYLRIADEKPYSLYESHITRTGHGVYKVIGFGDNLEDAITKVDRIITKEPIHIRSEHRDICPECGKVHNVRIYYSEYTWSIYNNVRSYIELISRLSRVGDKEILVCKPYDNEWHCKDCEHLDPYNDLPF